MTTSTPSARGNSVGANPLLEPWTGPYGGVPPFDQVKPQLTQRLQQEQLQKYVTDLRAKAKVQ